MGNDNNQYSRQMQFKDMDIEQKIMDRSSRFGVPDGISREEALSKLQARIASNPSSGDKEAKVRNLRLVYVLSSVAAGLLILLGVWQLFFRNSEASIVAVNGSRVEHHLPDGSEVMINAGSRIVYDKWDFRNERHLTLDGEAFFNVKKGSSFTVSATRGEVRVLGTSFNVYSRANSFRVTCLTGKVVVSAGNQSVIITPGETAGLNGSNLTSYNDEMAESSKDWVNGEFVYNNSPLIDVMDEIERQFNIKFAGQNFDSRFFTGSFTNKDLKEALDIVCIPMGIKYEIGNNGKVLISETHI
jgi:transmembrane sensor